MPGPPHLLSGKLLRGSMGGGKIDFGTSQPVFKSCLCYLLAL